jgi:hypothetical protein
MRMYPHEERVVEEKRDLDERLGRLNHFMATSPTFEGLSEDEKLLMRQQATAMAQYSGALGGRISRFKDTADLNMSLGSLPRVVPPQIPTIGRVVLFRSSGIEMANNAEEYVAIIGQVIADASNPRPYCNLLTFPPFQEPRWEGSVQEYDPDSPAVAPVRSWRWPPRA